MANPIKAILDRCNVGFTAPQKVLITAGILVYAVFPIDLIPDIIPAAGILDDVFAFFCLGRVWMSPTLSRHTRNASPPSAGTTVASTALLPASDNTHTTSPATARRVVRADGETTEFWS